MPGPALYLLDSGTITSTMVAGDGNGEVAAPVPYYLIRHPEGDVLFDGGNPLQCARDPEAHWGELMRFFTLDMSEHQHVAARVRALGVDPAAVRYVIQSHLHMDHTGALGHFPNAKVVVHRLELEAARRADPSKPTGYVHADFDRPDVDWHTIEQGEDELGFDPFGDGVIRTIFTPGHTRGHLSLLVTLPETGPVLLAADAAYTRAHYEGRLLPPTLVSREDTIRSVERLREVERETGALVVTGHDGREWEGLRKVYE